MALLEEKLSSLLGLEFKSKLEDDNLFAYWVWCDVGFSFI